MNLQENIQRIKEMMNLNEKLEDIQGTPLYHKTSTSRGLQILDSDKLIAGETGLFQSEFDKRLIDSDKQKAISFTRNKNWFPENNYDIGVGSGNIEDLDITLVLDKSKLETKYNVEPFNFLGLVSSESNFQRSNQNEFEERVLTDEIYPLHKYIIDVIYTGDNPEVQKKIDSYLNR